MEVEEASMKVEEASMEVEEASMEVEEASMEVEEASMEVEFPQVSTGSFTLLALASMSSRELPPTCYVFPLASMYFHVLPSCVKEDY